VTWKSCLPAAVLLALGCSASADPRTGDPRLDLRHQDPRVRMEAAYRAAQAGRQDLAEGLIENLRDRDESVRFITGIALKKLTGEDFGYRSYSSLAAREEAIGRWRRWLESRGGSTAGSGAPAQPAPPAAQAAARGGGGR
jgi:HEAT repeat protein